MISKTLYQNLSKC